MTSAVSTRENPQSVDGLNPPKRDHRQEVTDSIISMLEQGVAPWQRPWRQYPAGATIGRAMGTRLGRRWTCTWIAVGVALVVGASPALANTITVTTTQDAVDSNDHACSLREAIMVADNPGNSMDCQGMFFRPVSQ